MGYRLIPESPDAPQAADAPAGSVDAGAPADAPSKAEQGPAQPDDLPLTTGPEH